MSQAHTNHYHVFFAANYGESMYSCGTYADSTACNTTTPPSATPTPTSTSTSTSNSHDPLAPLTGFLHQSPFIVIPVLLFVTITIASLSYLVTKKLRALKQ